MENTFYKSKVMLAVILIFCMSSASAYAGQINGGGSSDAVVMPKHITFYIKRTCIYCKRALEYVGKEFPKLTIDIVDIDIPSGRENMFVHTRRLGLKHIRTPFILLNENEYIMGWGDPEEKRFREYVKKSKTTGR